MVPTPNPALFAATAPPIPSPEVPFGWQLHKIHPMLAPAPHLASPHAAGPFRRLTPMRPSTLLLQLILVLLTACHSISADPESNPAEASAAIELQPTDPELATRLLELMETDQAARNALIDAMQGAQAGDDGSFKLGAEHLPLVAAMQQADAASTTFLRELIDTNGWPSRDQVGTEAAHAAWLLAQHADAAPDLQARVLELMEPLVVAGQADGGDLAYLTDRVRAARGEPQLYGTQFAADASGVQRPLSITDVERVDERRASVGLSPLAEYAAQLREQHGGEVSIVPLD